MPTGIYIRTEKHKINWFKKGQIGWNKGKKGLQINPLKGKNMPKEWKAKLSSARIKIREKISGKNHPIWKADEVGFCALHAWVSRWKGKPDTCEHCGKTGLDGGQINWANIDHKYRRVLEDYIRLCVPCHRKYDIENNQYHIFGKYN